MSNKLINFSLISLTAYSAYKLITNRVFNYAFKKNEIPDKVSDDLKKWIEKSKKEKVHIISDDNLNLNGILFKNNKTKNYIICVHGIWSSKDFMYPYVYELDKLGYNILLIDQRASGDSDGEYYTYGYRESMDLAKWCDFLASKIKNIKICLFGVSMGAATCMMSTSRNLNKSVKCIIEDCGYSSLYEQFEHMLKNKYKIKNTKLVLSIFDNVINKKMGFKLDDVNLKRCLNTNKIPILLIHGEKDNFVPFSMVNVLYESNLGEKQILKIKNAKHSGCIKDKKYFYTINLFIKKYL